MAFLFSQITVSRKNNQIPHSIFVKTKQMSNLSVQIALDFVECTKEQKEKFLEYLKSLNWKTSNPNKLWVAEFKKTNSQEDKLKKVEQEIINAREISKLYEIDYMIITDDEIYFNQLN
ncbi:hypothetical protein [Empedobacter brevis]|uniref:hypothetical protein n=1 Tax=Empedobacter brevis TaxID=247 RepID=UPI0039AFC09A